MPARKILFLIAVLLFLVLSRLAMLGERPFHHDESLFAFYSWEMSSKGDFSHHPLLHGPLQIQATALILSVGEKLGLLGDGDAAARLLAALCGIGMVLPIWGMRKFFGKSGLWVALTLLAVSPGLWYYSRFFRNESPFILTTLFLVCCVARSWRERRPAPWIFAAFVCGALLVALKENSLFVFFDGFTFLVLLFAHQIVRGRPLVRSRRGRGFFRLLFGSFRRNSIVWMAGFLAAWLLLEILYSNFFLWPQSFLGKYAEIMGYWWGQHREHRLFGEYHYYFPILALYEPLLCAAALGGALVLFSKPKMLLPASILVLLGSLCLVAPFALEHVPIGVLPDWAPDTSYDFLRLLHMSSPWHLAFAGVTGGVVLFACWSSLSAGRVFRAWLIWWTGLSLLQYSYAGEKVPWISLHIVAPALLLGAELLGRWIDRQPTELRKALALAVVAVFALINLVQGVRLCFVHPSSPAELLVYNHTQKETRDVARRLRRIVLEPADRPRVLIQGEANWPLFWYLHGGQFRFLQTDEATVFDGIDYLVCDIAYREKHKIVGELFKGEEFALRQAWTPERLRLFTSWEKAEEERKKRRERGEGSITPLNPELYGLRAWRALTRYIVFRKIWGDPFYTALPLKCLELRRVAPTPPTIKEFEPEGGAPQ
jgi:uncharacterized protein (TIGR03663 family)